MGRLLGNMRAAVHSLVVFYSNQLAARQGRSIVSTATHSSNCCWSVSTDRVQTAAQLAALRAELAARDSGGETTAP